MGSRSPAQIRRLTLVACIVGSGIVLLDGTVVNVALPAIERALGGGLAGQQWLVGGYLLSLGSLILLGGALSDVYGERRVFAIGVATFGLASLLCALAPNIGTLIAFRALQGVAGALLVPSSLATIIAVFPPDERGPAIGTWTAFGGIATVLGPLAGGELIAVASWRWIFLLNVPLVLACLVLLRTAVPASPPREVGRRIDVPGGALAALGLAGPVFGLIEQPRLGWSSPAVWGSLLVGVLIFAAFLLYESRVKSPMLPLNLFSRRNFAYGNLETLAMYAGLSILIFLLVLFLQEVGGYTPLRAGLATLPVTVVMFVLSRRFGALADRYGPRLFMGVGPLVAAAGLLLFDRVGAHVDYFGAVFPAVVVFALGLSLTVAPLTAAVLAGVEERQAGIGSAVNNAIARVAGLVGTAAIGAVIAAHFTGSIHAQLRHVRLDGAGRAAVSAAEKLTLGRPSLAHLPHAEAAVVARAADAASTSAFHLGVGVAAALVALAGVIGLVGIENPRRRVSAQHSAGGQIIGAAPDAVLATPASPIDEPLPA
jgi:EmrB/QacA subfamily drug resistance transporter